MNFKEKGVLIGNTILLESPINIPERTKVEVKVIPIRKNIMKVFGLWKDRKNLSEIIKEIYRNRKKNRSRIIKI